MGLATLFVLVMSNIVVSSLRQLHPQAGAHRHLHPDHRHVRDGRGLRDPGDQPRSAQGAGRVHLADRRELPDSGAGRGVRLQEHRRPGRRWTASAWASASRSRCSASGRCARSWATGRCSALALFHDAFQDWVVMILPSGGFFTLAGLVAALQLAQAAQGERDTTATLGLRKEVA